MSKQLFRGRPRRIYYNRIRDFLKKSQILSTENRRRYLKYCIDVEEAIL